MPEGCGGASIELEDGVISDGPDGGESGTSESDWRGGGIEAGGPLSGGASSVNAETNTRATGRCGTRRRAQTCAMRWPGVFSAGAEGW